MPPAGIVSAPVPLKPPPVQVSAVIVKALVPLNVELLPSVSAGKLTLPSVLLKFTVPLVMLNVPRLIMLPVKFVVPPLTVVVVAAL